MVVPLCGPHGRRAVVYDGVLCESELGGARRWSVEIGTERREGDTGCLLKSQADMFSRSSCSLTSNAVRKTLSTA